MEAIRKHLNKEQFHLLNIPEDFAEKVELIILPVSPAETDADISEDERFYAANNNQIIKKDENEDRIRNKYL